MQKLVRDTFLEMRNRKEAVPPPDMPRLEVREAKTPCPEINHFFYRAIGAEWGWYDRVEWTRERWHEYTNRKDLQTWIATRKGCPAGYAELIHEKSNEIEIRSFGLLPTFIGQGLGQEFLATLLEIAWNQSPTRLWLGTCSLDHPRALPNYRAAGLKIFRTKEGTATLPNHSLSPWPTGTK